MKIKDTTIVFIRSKSELKAIKISNRKELLVTDEIIEKWQKLLDSIGKLIKVKAALINRIQEGYTELYLKSNFEDNNYVVGSKGKLCIGSYCEEVIGSNTPLRVENALEDPIWTQSFYVDYNLISYYGLPLLWPDGSCFGTLCVLDDKSQIYSDEFVRFFDSLRDVIEHDLNLIFEKSGLVLATELDELTLLQNRRGIDRRLEEIYVESKLSNSSFCLVMIDIDFFKDINDTFGHPYGDKVLKDFGEILRRNARQQDVVGRYGGDEYIIIFQGINQSCSQVLMRRICEKLDEYELKSGLAIEYSFGIACSNEVKNIEELVELADKRLYLMKKRQHRKKLKL